MTRGWLLLPFLVALGAVGLSFLRPPIRAVAWRPPGRPYTRAIDERAFAALELLPLPRGHGPESIIAGPGGWLYAGLKDGRIVRFRPDGSGMQTFASTGGRPNGMVFDAQGNLLVADSYRGLVAIGPDRRAVVLADEADGQSLTFTDGIALAGDGTVWLTDASARFPDGQFHYDVLEGRATGRLLRYDPSTGRASTRVKGLRFPNGIALGPDDAFLLVNETLGYRTLRHWIEGPKAGRTEPFVENLPGMPDDIRAGSRGLFWIALNAGRMAWVDRLQPHPRLKNLVATLVGPFFPDTDARWIGSGAHLLAIDLEGRVVHGLRDPGRRYVTSTGVLEHGGHLFIGSVVEPAVARVPLPQPAKSPGG